MKSTLLNLFIVAGLSTTALSMTACTDSDLSFGAGVIIGAIISDDGCDHCGHHHHDRPNPPRYDERHDHDHDRHRYGANFTLSSLNAAVVDQDVLAAANHYDIEVSAATTVMTALKQAEKQDFTKLAELGFTREDFMAMAKGDNPSAHALVTMSNKLNMDLGDGNNLIQDMKLDLAAGLSK